MPTETTTELQIQSNRPIEFRSISEEAAIGAAVGCFSGSLAVFLIGSLLGAIGDRIGRLIGWPTLVASALIWLTFWAVPLVFLVTVRPLWRYLVAIGVGAVYLAVLQGHIHQKDIGTFYPWILSALPFGIVLCTGYEPIRLARGGSTEDYANRRVTVVGGITYYGMNNSNEIFLMAGYILGWIADLLSFGRPRLGTAIGGFLGGGLMSLAASSLVAWRGDTDVAYLFFGNVWSIALIGTLLGAITGAASGWAAGSIRTKHEQLRLQLINIHQSIGEHTPSAGNSKAITPR